MRLSMLGTVAYSVVLRVRVPTSLDLPLSSRTLPRGAYHDPLAPVDAKT
jgi:hypothetical protein